MTSAPLQLLTVPPYPTGPATAQTSDAELQKFAPAAVQFLNALQLWLLVRLMLLVANIHRRLVATPLATSAPTAKLAVPSAKLKRYHSATRASVSTAAAAALPKDDLSTPPASGGSQQTEMSS